VEPLTFFSVSYWYSCRCSLSPSSIDLSLKLSLAWSPSYSLRSSLSHPKDSQQQSIILSLFFLMNKTLSHAGSAMDMSSDKLIRDQAMVSGQVKLGFTYICHSLGQINSSGLWFGDNPLEFSLPLLLLQLSLISIFTRSLCFLLKPFGQPTIVSHIVVSLSSCQDQYMFFF
jgi:hypothetical protein